MIKRHYTGLLFHDEACVYSLPHQHRYSKQRYLKHQKNMLIPEGNDIKLVSDSANHNKKKKLISSFSFFEWTRHISYFSDLKLEDQDGILLAIGLYIHLSSVYNAGVGSIFDRVLTELVFKMKQMDKLFVEVYVILEAYTKQKYLEQPGSFAKLLLCPLVLHSISLKCLEHLFFKLTGDVPIDTFLMEMEILLQFT
ncbi:hypothetical protein EI555_019813 [Monodon monoceros]|uniref:NR LBD domain-containing protein n=1 Tax=Monodon monoceros TaxID=40151 RepID=A0A4U1FKD0_MONMO|nr:hypothetical protein EI555_019813 [Monodon monoceros]